MLWNRIVPAFTRLCKKVNISVAHKTVTLYLSKKLSTEKQLWVVNLNDSTSPQDPFVKKLSRVQPVYRHHCETDSAKKLRQFENARMAIVRI